MALATEYGWAAGHGVALAALNSVANELQARNRRQATGALYRVGVRSQPVDAFPVRVMLGAGYEWGGGRIDHEWQMTLAAYAVDYVMDTYLSSGASVKAAMTINTRKHDLNTYGRYNCYLHLPSRSRGDIEYVRQGVFRVTWRFTSLVAL